MIFLLIAAWLSMGYLSLSLYLHKRELRKLNRKVDDLCKEVNKLHRDRKQKAVQIKRLTTTWN